MLVDCKTKGQQLLEDWYLYKTAKPKDHVFDIQIEKDNLQKWANLLQTSLLWEDNTNKTAKICYQFENQLTQFKEKIIIELLK